VGRLQWPNKRVTYNNNPRAAATRATTIKTTPNKSVNNRGNKSSSSRAAACLGMRPRWVPRKAYGACNALPCGVLLGVAQRLSMEYMQSLQLLKPGLLGQRPLVVITRDPQKVGACVAPPLFFFASLNTSGYNYSNHTARPRATLSSRKLPPPHRTSPIPTFQICLRGHGQQGAGGRLYANAQGDTAREAQHQELQHEVPPSSHCHVGLPGTCASLRLFSCLPHPLAPLFDFLASACKAVDAWKGRGGPRSWPRLARFNR